MTHPIIAGTLGALVILAGAVLFLASPVLAKECGGASWYGPGFHGKATASGARFNQNAMTAAHRSLPFGTRVRVTAAGSGRSVVVTITDRGPFVRRRVIDLSKAAATKLGTKQAGIASVCIERL